MATMTAYMTTDSQDLGPGSNLTATVGNKEVFVLDSEDQIALQDYVETAVRLPTSDSEMRMLLGYKTDAEGKKFTELIQVYSQIFSRCWYFKTQVYPESVFLAFFVSTYARKSFIYYDRLMKIFQEVSDKVRTITSAKEAIDYTVDELKRDAKIYAAQVDEVHTAFQEFDTGTTADQGQLELAVKFYSGEFNLNESIIQQEKTQIDTLKGDIEALKAEYEQAVIIASTTPIYAWIPILGWIVGSTVAGVYGAKAVEINNRIAALGEDLRMKSDDVQLRTGLEASLSLANQDLVGLKTKCVAARRVLARIKEVWTRLDAALDRIPTYLDLIEIGDDTALIVLRLALNTARNEWDTVYTQAEKYTATAYLRVEELQSIPR